MAVIVDVMINICKNDSGKNTFKNLQKQFTRETYLPFELAFLNVTSVPIFELIQQNIVHQSKKGLVFKTDNKIHSAIEYNTDSLSTFPKLKHKPSSTLNHVCLAFCYSIEMYRTTLTLTKGSLGVLLQENFILPIIKLLSPLTRQGIW